MPPSAWIHHGRPLPDAQQKQAAEDGTKRQLHPPPWRNNAPGLHTRCPLRGIFLQNHKWIYSTRGGVGEEGGGKDQIFMSIAN